MSPDQPIYISKASLRSFGNEYRIYGDRIELEAKLLFRTFVIPIDEIKEIDTYKPPVIRTVFWALKLDYADFFRHVGIERTNGYFKKIRFTPGNPNEFIDKVKELM
jgi:hypothetical protein